MRISRGTLLRLLLPGATAVAIFGLTAATGCKNSGGDGSSSTASGDTIKVGHLAAMTGSTASFGNDTDAGIRLAMDEINGKGGVLNKKLSVETLDDRSTPEEAKTVATKFAGDSGVLAVLGEVSSGRTIAAAPVIDRAGIPMVSPAATNADVTKKGEHIFRVCFIDPFQGFVMARFAKENLKLTKVAILRDKKNEYSVGLANVFDEEFKKMGGQIVADAAYQEGDSDFRSQLAQIKAAGPEGIFIPGYYGEVGPIARQAKELGLNIPLMGGDGWDSPDLIAGAGGPGGALEGAYFSSHYSKDDPSPAVQTFVKAYKAKFSKDPSSNAALGYDAMLILADAIKRAGSADREAVTKALAETKDFPGVTGVITIGSDRNARKAATVLEVKGSDFAFKAKVDPPAAQ